VLQQLIDAIEALTGVSADTVARPGVARCAVVHGYAGSSVYGEDSNLLDVPRAQIDIYTPTRTDGLIDSVLQLLQDWHMPYEIAEQFYDDETVRIRTIVQLDIL